MRKLFLSILVLALAACNQPTPIIDPAIPSGKSLGLVEVTFTGIGTNDFKSTARSISSNGQTRALTDLSNGLEMLPIAKTSFEIGGSIISAGWLQATSNKIEITVMI